MRKKQKKEELIYEDLRFKIKHGILKPLEKLPPERELARQHNISTVLLRKALSRLIDEKLITKEPRVGNFVAPRSRKIKEIGLVMSFPQSHPFLSEILYYMEHFGSKANINIIYKNASHDPLLERDHIGNLLDCGIKKFLVSPVAGTKNLPFYKRLSNHGINLVFLDRWLDIDGIAHEMLGFYELTKTMTKDMLSSGCKNIGFFGTRFKGGTVLTLEKREQGFLAFGEEKNLAWVYADEVENREVVANALQPLFENNIDGIVMGSSTLLPALADVIKEKNLKLNDDIKIAIHAVRPYLDDFGERYSIPISCRYPLNESVKLMCKKAIEDLATNSNIRWS
ncbi:MAG: GntR family transcriptional regulator [Victivallaceae bacterium]|nr:GntR family transcriptional regulator [Victivallaceae bacterium]